MAQTWNPVPLGPDHEQLSGRLSPGENLHRKTEKLMCPRPELLFLPGRSGLLPHRRPAGCHRKPQLSVGLLCVRLPDFRGRPCGALCLRLPVPLRADSGSASQNSVSEKAEDLPGRQAAAEAEICDPDPVCHPAAHVPDGHSRTGRAILLQADLSRRNSGGRHSSGAFKPCHAQRHRLALRLEKCAADCHYPAVHCNLPAFLQISLSAGRDLFRLQSHLGFPLPGGQGKMHRLRRMYPGL